MDNKLTIEQASLSLKVSKATINNWIKSRFLTSLTEKSVEELKTSGLGGRLTHRANKQSSLLNFTPTEYGGKNSLAAQIKNLLSQQKWTMGEALFYGIEDLIILGRVRPQNPFFEEELKSLLPKGKSPNPPGERVSFPLGIAQLEDFPGWLYQTLQNEGKKSLKGSYYTPKEIVSDILENLLEEGQSFFDPGCGTGSFLCEAAHKLNSPLAVYGQDIDPMAVSLARINLMLQFPQLTFSPEIYVGDSLLRPHNELKGLKFDRIGTNPPWGYRFNPRQRKKLISHYQLKSTESSSCFILGSLKHLKEDGRAAFLLPESLLHRECHTEIREKLINKVTSIRWYGKIFSRVQSECFALFLESSFPKEQRERFIRINFPHENYRRTELSLRNNPLSCWNIFTSPQEDKIFRKFLETPGTSLMNQCQWGLGIVTGNNRETLEPLTELTPLKREGEYRPILRGKDITPFTIKSPTEQLDYNREDLHQKAPLFLYGPGKIVYRFIATRPVMALDQSSHLTLNSVNICIPQLDLPKEIVLMLFNSTLYGLYFEKTFHTLKILRSQLEALPIPYLTDGEISLFMDLYSELVHGEKGAMERVNSLVYTTFKISTNEREILERKL